MNDLSSINDLLGRVRGGDLEAATELVRRYEPVVRAAVRVRLTDPSLRREFDSLDVCQSVLASFFVRAAGGLYDIEKPEQLIALLARMADYKFRNRSRGARRLRRDIHRMDPNADPDMLAADQPGPEDVALHRDLLSAIRLRLSADERELMERRTAGSSWPMIAAAMGGTARSRGQQLQRALNRAASELGLDISESDNE